MWQPPETAPKNGRAFLITTAGPQLEMCWWDGACFRDYFYKQRIPQEWPYMTAWQPLPDAAAVCNSEAESRAKNGFPKREAAQSAE